MGGTSLPNGISEDALLELVGLDIESRDGLDIPDSETGKHLLEQFEAEAFIGASQARDGMNRMAYAIFTIRENRLWLYDVEDGGAPKWAKWEDYLRDLADRGRIARSTAFGHLSAMRLATSGLGYSMEEVDDLGGVQMFERVRRYVDYDRSTGEIVGLADDSFEIPDGIEPSDYIRQVIMSVAPSADGPHDLDLTPADINRALREQLSNLPEIIFHLLALGNGGYKVGYSCYRLGEPAIQGTLADGAPPPEVMEKLQTRLRIP